MLPNLGLPKKLKIYCDRFHIVIPILRLGCIREHCIISSVFSPYASEPRSAQNIISIYCDRCYIVIPTLLYSSVRMVRMHTGGLHNIQCFLSVYFRTQVCAKHYNIYSVRFICTYHLCDSYFSVRMHTRALYNIQCFPSVCFRTSFVLQSWVKLVVQLMQPPSIIASYSSITSWCSVASVIQHASVVQWQRIYLVATVAL